jgi:hypothetical protein
MAEMKHMANKQMERHMNRGNEEMEKKPEHEGGEHESFHVSHHPVHGTHSTHTHAGGIDHAEHGSPEEAMEHGKGVMGHGEPDGDEGAMQPAMQGGGDEGWE